MYNRTVDPQKVVAPPYDVISPERQRELYEIHPNNVIRLILNREADPYTSAAQDLKSWIESSILTQDPEKALYVLHQEFTDSGGRTFKRVGVIGLCRLEEYSQGVVLPHEKTLPRPRADRLNLIMATASNFCQVFGLYADSNQTVDVILEACTKSEPDRSVEFEGIVNSIWRMADPGVISEIQSALMEKEIFIADGHHRYETALAYRNLMRERSPGHTGEEKYNYVLMFFTNMESDGLVVYPTHRVIHSLPTFDVTTFLARVDEYFSMSKFVTLDALLNAMTMPGPMKIGMRLRDEPAYYLLFSRPEKSLTSLFGGNLPPELSNLDVTVLHKLIIGQFLGISEELQAQKLNIEFVRDPNEAVGKIERGAAQIAFLLNPPSVENICQVARSGNTMPQKSTYFYPKLLSGLVMYRMAD